MRIYFDTETLNVCPRRRVLDILPFRHSLEKEGHEFVADPGQAERIYLFTCAFNTPSYQDSQAQIKEFTRRFGDSLVVAGCFPTIDLEAARRCSPGMILDNSRIRREGFFLPGGKDIPVSRGCLGVCSYCVDRKAVGPLQSRLLPEILDDLQAGLENGHTSFRIISDDLGAWGQDLGLNFILLLEEMLSLLSQRGSPACRLHLLEINANWLIQYQSKMEIFDTPLIDRLLMGIQSFNNRVLDLMRRPYDGESAYRLAQKLHHFPVQVGIHLMAGFPTETRQEFEETLSLIPRAGIDHGFIFAYSDMKGTPAYDLRPKVQDIDKRMSRAAAFLEEHHFLVDMGERDKIRFKRPRT